MLLIALPILAHAGKTVPGYAATHAPQECWNEAARRNGVDVSLLYAIAYVESGYSSNALNINRNGSLDLGMMQINTIWLPELARHGISAEHLLNPCVNIHVGAWILGRNLKKYGWNWLGLGAYNSSKPELARRYAAKVLSAHQRILALMEKRK